MTDLGVAVLLTVIALPWTSASHVWSDPDRRMDWLGLLIVGAATMCTALRRRAPKTTLAVVTVLTTTYLVLGYSYGPILIAFTVAVYTVARHLPPTVSLPVTVVAVAVLLVHVFTNSSALPGLLGVIRDPRGAWFPTPWAWSGVCSGRPTRGPGTRRSGSAWTRSGSGSPRRCTTSWGMGWRRSACRPTWLCT